MSVVERGGPSIARDGQAARLGQGPVSLSAVLTDAEHEELVSRYRTLGRLLASLIRQEAPPREVASVLLEVHELELRLLVHGQSLARVRFEEEELS